MRAKVLVLACAVLGPGCKPQAEPRSPGMGTDDISDLEAVLAANAADLRAAGVSVPIPPKTEAAPSEVPAQKKSDEEEDQAVFEDEELAGESAEPGRDVEAIQPTAPPSDSPVGRRSRRDAKERWSDRRRERKAVADRCQRICDLAEATCDLADHICSLAARHPDEVRYEDACASAEAQCRVASEACRACVR